MERDFDGEILKKRFLTLPRWKSIAFSLATCERMMPWFHAFAEQIGYEGEDVLRESLDIVWDMLAAGEDRRDLMRRAHMCGSIAPHMDDYGDMPRGFGAMNAACAVALLMDCISSDMDDCASIIASQIVDVVDSLVQDEMDEQNATPSSQELEIHILAHPLMQTELLRQREDLKFLVSLSEYSAAALPAMRGRWKTIN